MLLVMVVWLPLATTISMVPHLVRISVLRGKARNKVSAPHRHNVHNKANVLRDNVRHKASASSLPVVIK
jgi:hypothetical protein